MSITTAIDAPFHFPRARQYPFDEVCERIVRALANRWYMVPDFVLLFDRNPPGGPEFVREILVPHEVRLRFARLQGHFNFGDRRIADSAAVGLITIAKCPIATIEKPVTLELYVEERESACVLYTMVGGSWLEFSGEPKMGNVREGGERRYLRYAASYESTRIKMSTATRTNLRPPFFVHDRDRGREHDLMPGEPRFFPTDPIFDAITQWLMTQLLPRIEQA